MRILTFVTISLLMISLRVQSQELHQPWFVIDQGGGKSGGGNLSVDASIGQPLVQMGSGGDFTLRGGFIPGLGQLSVTAMTLDLPLEIGWNMVSIPLTMSTYAKSALYPAAVSRAFAYDGQYVTKDTLKNGVGYWIKLPSSQNVSLTGIARSLDTVDVQPGWNMTGSISDSVSTSQINSDPPGIVTSQFFEYSNGYQVSHTIQPGKAYWVKVNQKGRLILSSSASKASAAAIKILAISELPPLPPEPGISNLKSQAPNQFLLEQNYPNPFNPTTVMRYQLPVAANVTLKVYNALGQEEATLVDGMQEAGYKTVTWDASSVASGVYYCRIIAVPPRGPEQTGSFVDTKKLALVK